MPLQYQPLEIPLNQSVDTKTDPRLVDNSRPTALLNATFDGRGTLRKRPGSSRLAYQRTDTGAVPGNTGRMLFSHNKQLVELHSAVSSAEVGQVLAYSQGAGTLTPRGDAKMLRLSKTTLFQDSAAPLSFLDADLGGSDTYEVHAYTQLETALGTSTLYLSIRDVATGTFTVRRSSLLTGQGSTVNPRVIGTTGVFYRDTTSNGLKFRPLTTPTTIGAQVAVTSSVTGTWDACARAAGGSLIVYYDSVATKWKVSIVDTTGTITSTRTFNAFGGFTPNGAIATIAEMSNGNVAVAIHDTVSGLLYYVLSSTLTLSSGGTVIDAVVSAPSRLALGLNSSNTATVAFDGAGLIGGVKVVVVSSTATVTTASARWAATGVAAMLLAGQPFYAADGGAVVPVVYNSTTQCTHFLLRAQYSAHGRFFASSTVLPGGAVNTRTPQARLTTANNYTQHILCFYESDFSGAGGYARVVVTALGDTANPDNHQAVSLDGKTYLSGACPFFFDGVSLIEEGFHHYPEAPTAVDTATAGGPAAGTYQWLSLFEWTDETGVLHRSAPGIPVSFTTAGGFNVAVTPSNLVLTERLPAKGRADVRLVVFRTIKDGSTVFYRLTEAASGKDSLPNDPSFGSSALFRDNNTDATIQTKESVVLESAGGPLGALPAPAFSHICVHQQRLFGVSAERDELAYSTTVPLPEELAVGTAVLSNTEFRLKVPPDGGDLMALASLDDKLVIFRRFKRYVVFGQGPNSIGTGATYTDPQPQPDDVGCIDANSVVSTPSGIMFHSQKGYYLLDRGLNLTYVGADVEAYTTNVRRALLVPTQNHVRFLLGATVLVYNYEFGRWAVWTGATYLDGCVWYGLTTPVVALLKSDGSINYEDGITLVDGFGGTVTAYTLSFDTAWLKLGGIAGFERVRWVTLIGDLVDGFGGSVTVRLSFLYDYDDNAAASDTVNLTFSTSGGEANPVPVLLRHKPARQKCTAMKIRVTEVTPDTYARLAFSVLRLEVGVKQGSAKLPATRTV